MRMPVPSSAAMIMASEVLPSPGAPDSSTWSGGRPRRRALSRTRPTCSRTRSCPTNSSSRRGRSAASTTRSWSPAPACTRACSPRAASSASSRATSSSSLTGCAHRARPSCAAPRAAAPGRRRRRRRGGSPASPSTDLVGLRGRPAQPDERLATACRASPEPAARRADRSGAGQPGLVLELEHHALRALAADAGHQAQRGEVLGGQRAADGVGRVHGEHRLRQPRADAGGGLQQLEQRALVVVGEAVERQAVLAHDQRGGQQRRLPHPQPGAGAGVVCSASPTPPTRTTTPSAVQRRRRCPRRWRSPARPRRRRRPAGPAPAPATGGRSRAPARRRRRPASAGRRAAAAGRPSRRPGPCRPGRCR